MRDISMNRLSTKAALGVVVALALFFASTVMATPPTTAAIVEGASMGKVRLSMKKSAVLAAFGKPAWCFNPSSKDDQECDWLAPPDTKIKGLPEPVHSIGAVSVHFWKGRVRGMGVMAPIRDRPGYERVPLLSEWRTSKGIGLGSSTGAVRAAYPGAKEKHYSAGRLFAVTTRRGGKTLETDFLYTTANVFQITIYLMSPPPP